MPLLIPVTSAAASSLEPVGGTHCWAALYTLTHRPVVRPQVAENCSVEAGFNVVDEIIQRVLCLYPAAVDVELDDDPTVIDGISSVHNSAAAWKKRLHNYRAEQDHFAAELDGAFASCTAH